MKTRYGASLRIPQQYGGGIDVHGCDLWVFGDDGAIVRKDSFWKSRDA
jgi:hypothetical protein